MYVYVEKAKSSDIKHAVKCNAQQSIHDGCILYYIYKSVPILRLIDKDEWWMAASKYVVFFQLGGLHWKIFILIN